MFRTRRRTRTRAIGVGLAAAATLLAAAPASGDPAPPGAAAANGDILFSDDGANYLVRPDGTDVRPTTLGRALRSPDGTKVAFSKKTGSRFEDLFIMNADGSGLTQLTKTDAVFERLRSWSHDGQRLLFERGDHRDRVPSGYAVMPARAGASYYYIERDDRPIAGECVRGSYRDARWSPTRNEVALLRTCYRASNDEIVLLDASRKTVRKRLTIDSNADAPSYDDTGDKIAYGYGKGISWVSRATGVVTQVLPPDTDRSFVYFPVWSPDGTALAYDAFRNYNGSDIGVVNADGSNPRIVFRSTSEWGASVIDWLPADAP